MQKWEYKFLVVRMEDPLEANLSHRVITVDGKALPEPELAIRYLNYLGNSGWEIIHIAPSELNEHSNEIFFKRPIE